MNRPVIVFVAVVLLVAYASAQPDHTTNNGNRDNFSVSPVGDSAVLLDAQTGQSWLLHHPVSPQMPSVWLPMQRLDGKADVMLWHAEQAELAAVQSDPVE